jgi:hypothetical protein
MTRVDFEATIVRDGAEIEVQVECDVEWDRSDYYPFDGEVISVTDEAGNKYTLTARETEELLQQALTKRISDEEDYYRESHD